LVLEPLLVYVAMPMLLLPTMTATSAMGTCPTSAYHLKTLLLTQKHQGIGGVD